MKICNLFCGKCRVNEMSNGYMSGILFFLMDYTKDDKLIRRQL